MRSAYPLSRHLLCLIPTLVMLCLIRLYLGPEDAVFAFFTKVRTAHPDLTVSVKVFTETTNTIFYMLYGAMFYYGFRNGNRELVRFVLAYALAQILVTVLLGRVIKLAAGRPRPMTGGPWMPFSFGWGYHSFPSGHVTEIVGSCVPLAHRCAGMLMPLSLGVLTALMGLSRIYLSMHHPSDVAGGLVLGSLTAYLAWRFATSPRLGALFDKVRPRKPLEKQ